MNHALKRHLTFANIVAALALFVALGGTSYAAITVTGKNVKDGSLTGKDIKNGSVAAADLGADAKLSGPQGPRGADGARGSDGAPGAPGATGPTGSSEPVEALVAAKLSGAPKTSSTNCNAVESGAPTALAWTNADYLSGGVLGSTVALCSVNRPRVLVVPKAGLYSVGAGIGWVNPNGTGRRELAVAANTGDYIVDASVPAHAGVQFQSVHGEAKLAAGSTIQAVVVQDSGTDVDLYDPGRGGLWLHYEGPLE